MSLPACQQHALDTIESMLHKREPRLTAMFAMFTRLNKSEGVPRTERLEAVPWWAWLRRRRRDGRSRRARWSRGAPVRPILLIPIVVILLASIICLGVISAPASCTPATGLHGLTTSHSASHNCTSAPEFRSGGHP
jgi:hypothetical protein